MSRAYDSMYLIKASRRRALYNERICASTEEFYNRYLRQYNEMVNQGFIDYIPKEMNRLKGDLDEIRKFLLNKEGKLAREESMAVGRYIHNMYALARSSMSHFEREERIKSQMRVELMNEKMDENLKYYYSKINEITDPVVRDFAQEDLTKLKNYITDKSNMIGKNLESVKSYIDKSIINIKNDAEIKSNEWRRKIVEENKRHCQNQMIEQVEEDLKVSNIEDKNKVNEIMNMIEKLKAQAKAGEIEVVNTQVQLQEITKEIDDTVVSESVRKEAVKAIVKSLKKEEFTVEKVELIENEKNNYVKVVAKKPSGKRAECRVGLDGNIKYKFDNYDGMTCIKDIEQFDVDLKEIYSITLSNKKILWENPIRISKDALKVDKTNKRGL